MCDLCELVFTSKEKLDTHVTVAHDDEMRSESVSGHISSTSKNSLHIVNNVMFQFQHYFPFTFIRFLIIYLTTIYWDRN